MNREEVLDEIVEWWLSRATVEKDSESVRFNRDNTRVTTIRLSQKMFVDATALAKSRGTTLNRLVERLLFEELGRPGVYLKDNPDLPLVEQNEEQP